MQWHNRLILHIAALASYVGANQCHGCPTSGSAPCAWSSKAIKYGPIVWPLQPHGGPGKGLLAPSSRPAQLWPLRSLRIA